MTQPDKKEPEFKGYRYLKKGEIIRAGDEYDACRDSWRDNPIWKPVHQRIGQPAPDPQYPAHTIFRRKHDTG